MEYQNSIINPNFSEKEWIDTAQRSLHGENHSQENDPHHFIFRVPKSIKDFKPEYYSSQRIAFGPYHHFRPGSYMAQKFKLEKIKNNSKNLSASSIEQLVAKISEKSTVIRAYYNEQFYIHDATLSWIMVIDGLFLLELIKVDKSSKLVDAYGRKFPVCSLLEDAVMIENQIPFYVLEQLESSSESLAQMAYAFCEKVSPIESNVQLMMMSRTEQPFHLLHLLYKFVCFEVEEYSASTQSTGQKLSREAATQIRSMGQKQSKEAATLIRSTGRSRKRSKEAATQIRSTGQKLSRKVAKEKSAPNFKFQVMTKVSAYTIFVLQLVGLCNSLQAAEEKALIPSASELSKAKVKLRPNEAKKGVNYTKVEKKDPTLFLPTLTLNSYSNVVIRNLLAYEAVARPGNPIFNRYIEMMTAMIRTSEDVRILKEEKILKHDGDIDTVIKLFKGFGDCVACEGKTVLAGVVKEINEHYNGKWTIKFEKFIVNLVVSSMGKLKILILFFYYFLIILDILYVTFPPLATFFTQLTLRDIGKSLTNLFVKTYPVYLMTRWR